MKQRIILCSSLVLVFGSIAVLASGIYPNGSKRFTVKPGASVYLKVDLEEAVRLNVRAKADSGNVAITIINRAGKTVARGVNRASYKTGGSAGGRYKIVSTNKTKRLQKVVLSWKVTIDN